MSSSNTGGPAAKKAKAKKNVEPSDTGRQIELTMARLEKNEAGEREQDQEVDREVKKTLRELEKQLSTCADAQQRAESILKKYSSLLTEMKRAERDHKKQKQRAEQLQKEKDTMKTELNRTVTLKDKLEKLSRDTNNENKKLRAENQRFENQEVKLRQDLHDQLEDMVVEVETVILANERRNEEMETLETDELFRHKFRSFVDQYELRELHFNSLLRQKELEIQYQVARFEQQRKAQEAESSKSHQLTRQVSTFSQTETELRSQLNIYVEKFKQVEDTLNNSNDLFLTFRKEMEEMSKKTKRLEKENLTLTRKHDATNQNILTMAEERTRQNKELETLRRRNEQLEKLCRGMQAQGRGVTAPLPPGVDGEAEEELDGSEYEDEDEYDDGSDEDAYDEDEDEDDETEDEAHPPLPHHPHPHPHPHPHHHHHHNTPQTRAGHVATYGPAPSPPQTLANGLNGRKIAAPPPPPPAQGPSQKQHRVSQLNGIRA